MVIPNAPSMCPAMLLPALDQFPSKAPFWLSLYDYARLLALAAVTASEIQLWSCWDDGQDPIEMMGKSSMAQDKEPLKVTFPCPHAWCEDEARQDKQALPIFLNLVVFCTELRPKCSSGEQGLFCLLCLSPFHGQRTHSGAPASPAS